MSPSTDIPANISARLSSAELAEFLREAVRAQRFEETADALLGGAAAGLHPSLDLAVAVFPPDEAPVFANVLFSREHRQGLVADISATAGPVRNIHYVADQLDEQKNSAVWLPGADWQVLTWRTLAGEDGQPRIVAPYPGSLIKLMILVAVARQVDLGLTRWDAEWTWQERRRTVREWAFDMTVVSCNDATSAMVALLHDVGALRREGGVEVHNAAEALFRDLGLSTLRLANTKPDGGWRNADGAGVGQLQMTAWDALRLLWLLDEQAPAAPWLPADAAPLLKPASHAEVTRCLREQGLHQSLSSSLLVNIAGWVRGIPARVPERWLQADGSACLTEELVYPGDLRPEREQCDVSFAHKTGNTENYTADAGIVQGLGASQRHYLIALTSNLGSRYAPDPHCATSWRIPALAGAIDARLRAWLEP
ncbi:MAG TPA: serine hydrolase [Burkholderiaceae bacterium]|jgi:hypothetical protein